MKIELRINLAAICRWERLTDRSFATLDMTNEGDLMRLLYCASPSAIEEEHTFEIFEQTLHSSKNLMSNALYALNRHNAYIEQFRHAAEHAPAPDNADTPERISAVVARLIVQGGMSPEYVLEKMPIDDLTMYADALSESFKREEESRRLWCFLGLIPHVKEGAIKTPKDLYRFPWEEAEIASKAEDDLAKLRQSNAEFKQQLQAAKWKQFKA